MVLMVSFGLFIPIIAPGDDVKHLVPSLLADAKELKFPRPSRTWPLPCADAACFRVHFNLVDPVSTNDEPKLFYQTKDYSDGFFLIGAFHRMCAGMLGSAMQRKGVDVSMRHMSAGGTRPSIGPKKL